LVDLVVEVKKPILTERTEPQIKVTKVVTQSLATTQAAVAVVLVA
jgi:hypothetical protein